MITANTAIRNALSKCPVQAPTINQNSKKFILVTYSILRIDVMNFIRAMSVLM